MKFVTTLFKARHSTDATKNTFRMKISLFFAYSISRSVSLMFDALFWPELVLKRSESMLKKKEIQEFSVIITLDISLALLVKENWMSLIFQLSGTNRNYRRS